VLDIASVGEGGEGLGFGLVRNHVWTEKLCLLITMSRMDISQYVPMASLVVYNILWAKSRRLRVKYSFLLHIVVQLCPLSIVSSTHIYIYTH
jgi:hypothetical protein